MTVSGKIKRINQSQTFGTFTKRTFWVETEETYPQILELFFGQDKVSMLDRFSKDQVVECEVNLRGRYWEKDGREGVIISLNAWRIKLVKNDVRQLSNSQPNTGKNEQSDDLPF